MSDELRELRTIADYQFGAGAGAALFPPGEDVEIRRSTGGRPRQVYADVDAAKDVADDAASRLVSFGTDGRFTLGFAGGRRLRDALPAPAARVVVGEESEPFVREGRNAFAKFVRGVDPAIRPDDEVLVVDGDDVLLGVGRAELSATGMEDFQTGMAVKMREGADEAGSD